MTIDELRGSGRAFVYAADIAPILGCDPQAVRITAREHPEWLGFPVVCVGSRVKIPVAPFLAHWTGKKGGAG